MKNLSWAVVFIGTACLVLTVVILMNAIDINRLEKARGVTKERLDSFEGGLDSLRVALYPKWEWDPETKKWEKTEE